MRIAACWHCSTLLRHAEPTTPALDWISSSNVHLQAPGLMVWLWLPQAVVNHVLHMLELMCSKVQPSFLYNVLQQLTGHLLMLPAVGAHNNAG